MTPKTLTCDDCYFRTKGLCALATEVPCPTFRSTTSRLAPPRQPQLVARPLGLAERTLEPAYAAATA